MYDFDTARAHFLSGIVQLVHELRLQICLGLHDLHGVRVSVMEDGPHIAAGERWVRSGRRWNLTT